MLIKIEFIIVIYYISEVCMQNPACRHFDFNDSEIDVASNFTRCQTDDLFDIASYDDTDIERFRIESEFYLTNVQSGFSCFRTTQLFNLDENTVIDSAIFLHSSSNDSSIFVDIMISDPVNGVQLLGESVVTSNEWTQFSTKVDYTADNATVEIRAFTTDDTRLAIEYIYIVKPGNAEQYCMRPITTTAAPTDTTYTTETSDPTETNPTETSDVPTDTSNPTETTNPTETNPTVTTDAPTGTSDAPTETSDAPTETNERVILIALSITFFLTTFIVTAGLIYVIYLYKTAAFMKNSLLMAPAKSPPTSIPRLTITNSINGNQVIVGIERTYNNGSMIRKH